MPIDLTHVPMSTNLIAVSVAALISTNLQEIVSPTLGGNNGTIEFYYIHSNTVANVEWNGKHAEVLLDSKIIGSYSVDVIPEIMFIRKTNDFSLWNLHYVESVTNKIMILTNRFCYTNIYR